MARPSSLIRNSNLDGTTCPIRLLSQSCRACSILFCLRICFPSFRAVSPDLSLGVPLPLEEKDSTSSMQRKNPLTRLTEPTEAGKFLFFWEEFSLISRSVSKYLGFISCLRAVKVSRRGAERAKCLSGLRSWRRGRRVCDVNPHGHRLCGDGALLSCFGIESHTSAVKRNPVAVHRQHNREYSPYLLFYVFQREMSLPP